MCIRDRLSDQADGARAVDDGELPCAGELVERAVRVRQDEGGGEAGVIGIERAPEDELRRAVVQREAAVAPSA